VKTVVKILSILGITLCIESALAQSNAKDPLSYPLRVYGLMLLMAIFGGFVSWYGKVVRKELPAASLFHLIGELATSAFAGMMMFFFCEWAGSPTLLTVALVSMSGHMGAKLLGWGEEKLKKFLEKKAEVLNG
jgi:hypothetical protein